LFSKPPLAPNPATGPSFSYIFNATNACLPGHASGMIRGCDFVSRVIQDNNEEIMRKTKMMLLGALLASTSTVWAASTSGVQKYELMVSPQTSRSFASATPCRRFI
jgi:hypothetical protein